MPEGVLFTIGHSTRTLDEVVSLLREHGIQLIVDVRRFPGSRRLPHFGRDALQASLAEAGIGYRHEVVLGGRRSARKGSPNTHWRVDAFRAYADHQATPEFQQALSRVITETATQPTAVMCAEAVPWRCHRQLIADAAVARGVPVLNVIGPGQAFAHVLNPAARVLPDGTLVYPASSQRSLLE